MKYVGKNCSKSDYVVAFISKIQFIGKNKATKITSDS